MMRARDNPFRTDLILQIRYRPLDESIEAVRERLVGMKFRGAIVGPMGSGKTTLMEDLARWVESLGYRAVQIRICLEDGKNPVMTVCCGDPANAPHCISPLRTGWRQALGSLGIGRLTENDVVFLDGADLLGFLRWKYFQYQMRNAGGLVIAAHKSGLMPTLMECRTTPGILREMATRLNAPRWMVEEGVIGKLYEKHGGNIREALREMYDLCGQEG